VLDIRMPPTTPPKDWTPCAGEPRWLLLHGRAAEAQHGRRSRRWLVRRTDLDRRWKRVRRSRSGARRLPQAFRVLFVNQWQRLSLGATLTINQSFLYNAIFFTYALVLTHFYGVNAATRRYT
jgi:hypothetical protein